MYVLSPFPFQSFSPIRITPFQVLPVFRSNAGPESLNLHQVYQPVPRDLATDPTNPIVRWPVSKRESGAIAEGYRVSTAEHHCNS